MEAIKKRNLMYEEVTLSIEDDLATPWISQTLFLCNFNRRYKLTNYISSS